MRDYSRLATTAFEQTRLKAVSAIVVGAGALGNEVIKNLALMGVGRLVIIDKDIVELSNLTRSVLFCTPDISSLIAERISKAHLAARRVSEINPDVRAEPIVAEVADVGLGVFRRADVVFSCVDNEVARLEISWACLRVNRMLVDGGLGLFNYSTGQVSMFPGAEGPCYLCRKTASRRRELLQELHGREDPCWMKEAAGQRAGVVVTTPLMASGIAALQVEVALRLLIDPPAQTSGASWRLTFHPTPSMEASQFGVSPTCPLHEPSTIVRRTTTLKARWSECTAEMLLRSAGLDRPVLRLDWPITSGAECSECHAAWEPLVRRAAFRRTACPQCGSRSITERQVLTCLTDGDSWSDRLLAVLAQPVDHIYEIVDGNEGGMTVHVEIDDGGETPTELGTPC